MIRSTSNTPQSGAIPPPDLKPAAKQAADIQKPDTLDTTASSTLREALAALPEVRPEEVEKGNKLAVDLNYPSRTIIENLSRLFVKSQDLSTQD